MPAGVANGFSEEIPEGPGRPATTASDRIFALPRLAEIYDDLDGERNDLDACLAIAADARARAAFDIGRGTGELALRLAARGLDVTGVDPATLDVARAKPGGGNVRWVHGVAADALPIQVDLATMTGNVAQVFVEDGAWDATLRAAGAAPRSGSDPSL